MTGLGGKGGGGGVGGEGGLGHAEGVCVKKEGYMGVMIVVMISTVIVILRLQLLHVMQAYAE